MSEDSAIQRLFDRYPSAVFPLSMLVALFVFVFLYWAFALPSPQEILILGEAFFLRFGYFILFFAALIEGIFLINFYFPGSFVIVLAVFYSSKSAADYFHISAVIFFALLAATCINFVIGRQGWHSLLRRIGAERSIAGITAWSNNRGLGSLFLVGFHPNALAICVVALASGGVRFSKVLAATCVSLAFWVPLAVFLVSIFISTITRDADNAHFVVGGVLGIWVVLALVWDEKKRGANPTKPASDAKQPKTTVE